MIDYLTFTPAFPAFQGPLNVGSTVFEILASEIDRSVPDSPTKISTVKARVYYPTSDTPKLRSKAVWWLQEPSSESLAAFCRFLGARERTARAISYLPSFVKRTKIPAIGDATVLEPTEPGEWPVAIFSHGLGGTCNNYSQIAGNLASCGVVVFALEHRDGSAPISLINNPDGTVTAVDYKRLAHDPVPEVLDARNEQFRIRMAELDLLYCAIEQLNEGVTFTNLALEGAKSTTQIPSFTGKLELAPSKLIWMGHSFGAATMVQFLKSVYWSDSQSGLSDEESAARVLYKPVRGGRLDRQVTPKSPTVLLDMWTMPLQGEKTRFLYDQPLPCFDDDHPTCSTVLSVMSQEFYNYSDLLQRTKFILSGNPQKSGVRLTQKPGKSAHGPRLFYVKESAHLNQSDFGVLFPWITKRFMGAAEPDRIMNLNMRAILQLLRENRCAVRPIKVYTEDAKLRPDGITQDGDRDILTSNGEVRNWTTIPLGFP